MSVACINFCWLQFCSVSTAWRNTVLHCYEVVSFLDRYILASFYTKYDATHFLINTCSLLSVLLPKLPQFHGVRILGINKYWPMNTGMRQIQTLDFQFVLFLSNVISFYVWKLFALYAFWKYCARLSEGFYSMTWFALAVDKATLLICSSFAHYLRSISYWTTLFPFFFRVSPHFGFIQLLS